MPLFVRLILSRSFAKLLQYPLTDEEASDSEDVLDALFGKSKMGREVLIGQGGALSILKGNWKYIQPRLGPVIYELTNTESGNLSEPQLYDLNNNIGEQNNLATRRPELVDELAKLLQRIKD